MAFYVPLGPRGLVFRLGTFVIGIWGGLVYRLAYRRRAIVLGNPGSFPSIGLGAGVYVRLEDTPPVTSGLGSSVILSEGESAAFV